MKLSELVKALTYELNEHGDIDVILASDEEGNSLYNVEDISTFDDDDTAMHTFAFGRAAVTL